MNEPTAGETAFVYTWRALGGDPDDWEREYRFAPPRRWRFDFAMPDKRIAVEVDGGTWTGGRHVRGDGFRRDAEKRNMAASLGWRVWTLTTEMASDPDEVGRIMAATGGPKCPDCGSAVPHSAHIVVKMDDGEVWYPAPGIIMAATGGGEVDDDR